MCVQNLLLAYYQVKQKPLSETKVPTSDPWNRNQVLYHWATGHHGTNILLLILEIDDDLRSRFWRPIIQNFTGYNLISILAVTLDLGYKKFTYENLPIGKMTIYLRQIQL